MERSLRQTAKLFRIAIATAALSLAFGQGAAAAYPEKPVRLVVPVPPGGPADATGRLLAQKLTELWNVPVIVENKAGADMQIGGAYVARAPADGYTLMLTSVTFTMSKSLYDNLPYDPLKDFTWISGFSISPMLLVTAESSKAGTAADLIKEAKNAPEKSTFASVSSLNFIGGELFKKAAGIQSMNVPYKGSAASLIAVSTGETSWTLDSLATVRPLLEAKRVKVLGVTGKSRLAQLPNVPTLAEAGLKDFEVSSWFAVTAPANLDNAVKRKIHSDLQVVMAKPELQQKLREIGMAPMPDTMESFQSFVVGESRRFDALIKSNHLRPNQ